jgi:hypothetical protein
MKLKDILDDYNIELYRLNDSIFAPTMFGAMLFKGNAKLLENSPHCEKNVFRIFEYKNIGKTIVIVN